MSKDQAAVRVTVARIEETLAGSPAFTRVEPTTSGTWERG
jgi:hypothetical protein